MLDNVYSVGILINDIEHSLALIPKASGAFSLISLTSLHQSRHGTYQIRAEYLTYQIVSFILLVLIQLKM